MPDPGGELQVGKSNFRVIATRANFTEGAERPSSGPEQDT